MPYYSGIIKRASPALTGQDSSHRAKDYYYIGIKTDDGKRLLLTIGPSEMGWSGKLDRSKIFYYRAASHRIIKTTMSNPAKYIGTRVKVRGELHSINVETKKYKLSPFHELILYLE